jgi:hypothetical protein
VRGDIVTPARVGVLALLSGFLLASCASPVQHRASPPRHPAGSTTSVSAPAPTTTVPATGPLLFAAPVPIPISAAQITATEAADGAVFVAPQNPDGGASVVWVVDGGGPAAIAEHMPAGVAALAADSTNLYVASYNDVTAFNRASGNQDGEWPLTGLDAANDSASNLVSMTVAGGEVLVTVAAGFTTSVYQIDPTTTAAPALVAQGLSVAIGPDGSVYYERADHRLVRRTSTGTVTVGPALADAPNNEGGGVQSVEFVGGGAVWVTEPAGQGLDTQFSTYDDQSLRLLATFSGSTTEQFADTATGVLATDPPGGQVSCPVPASGQLTDCLYRVSTAGAAGASVPVGTALAVLGQDPVVIESNASSTELELVRVS